MPTNELFVLYILFLLFQDGLVHIYDLQSGQWITAFQAASGMLSFLARPVMAEYLSSTSFSTLSLI